MATYGYERSWRTHNGWMQVKGQGYATPEAAEIAGNETERLCKRDNPEVKPWLERAWEFLFDR